MDKMQKAVIYTRVSTDEQAKNGLSLEGQETAARQYCEREGIEVAKLFCDAGESAKTANRPQLIASIDYCTMNYRDIDFYIVWKMDRLARQAYDSAMLDATLQKLGIQLRSVTEPIANTAVGSLTKTMLAGIAQFDNDVRAERSTSGIKRRIEEGGWPHLAPIGYKNFTDFQRRPTLVETEQAPIIAKWLREYLKGGYNLRAMNELAWKMGLRSRKGKKLSFQQTCNMLRNPIYAGLVFSKMIEAPVEGLHKALITVTEHKAILDKLDGRNQAGNGVVKTFKWPLRGGFIKCSECGRSITGSSPTGRAKNYPIYHCPECRAKVVGHRVSRPKNELHDDFEALLQAVTPSEATLKLFRIQVVKKWQTAHLEQRKLQKQLQRELVTLRDRKQRVVTLFIDGNLTPQEKEEQTLAIDSEIFGTELKLKETSDNVISTDTLIDFGINMIENAAKLWRIADEVEKQRLQVAIFPEGLNYDFVDGFGTAKTGDLYLLIEQFENSQVTGVNREEVVGVVGIEPTTKRL
jgi:DNA invertase Pin-like site-specific DNA recombinase/DNA-directed RNA polymerase subunit RPC12/RpoP